MASGGARSVTEYWGEHARWRSIVGAPDDRGPIHGRAAVRVYIEDWVDTFAEFRVEVVELIDVDEETVVAALRYGGRTKQGDVELPGTPFAAIFVVRDGQIVGGGEYETLGQALEAAGLSE
jgi:ketosteroid isomerase-like protein